METVFRVFVEKKPAYAQDAVTLLQEMRDDLGLSSLSGLRIFNRYDVQGITAETFTQVRDIVFAEPPVDNAYDELPATGEATVLAVEYLPGQFDQRADSAAQCIQMLTRDNKPLVRYAKVYVLSGPLSAQEIEKIEKYLINPVEAQLASLEKPESLEASYPQPQMVPVIEGFIGLTANKLQELRQELGLAMDDDDLLFCQEYFAKEERRDPTMTELRVLDTYWSDHCRHTSFHTQINRVDIKPDYIWDAFNQYMHHKKLCGKRNDPVTLMSIATTAMQYLKKSGRLPALDESEEINACSIKIKVDVDGEEQDWLLMFKNETHNHPTEIEPFGGAATCLGGAIRDPLSGRSYVYQAMRVTGASDPRQPYNETLPGRLPQRKITTSAAAGYSSYGNQIGLATGLVHEFYHPAFVAKRMEIGAVIGAAPAENVVRREPRPGDIILLIGGRTGRDGCGGATGSSKSHDTKSITTCGSEVQKGNPPEERKIQRLFRNPEATKLIKRCNDFGAGGVSVAIGELADGLYINLNAVPKKYEGLDGTELAISESQERMAVVVAEEDVKKFMALAAAENIESTIVAQVQSLPRLQMLWQGRLICDISRRFLNSNGAPKKTTVSVDNDDLIGLYNRRPNGQTYKEQFANHLSRLNNCCQKGLVERFDNTIGAGTVVMPFGGRWQLSPVQYMAAKLPVLSGNTDTCSVMSFGYNPHIAEKSAFHSAQLAVVESVARLVAAGMNYRNIYLSLQEYFGTLSSPEKWGKPFAALLGAFQAQLGLGLAAIGGKDSMSGSFEDLDVPPTLVSFAVGTMKAANIVTPEFKHAGHNVYFLRPDYKEFMLPNLDSCQEVWRQTSVLQKTGHVFAAWALSGGGLVEGICKMAFGNYIGFRFNPDFPSRLLYRMRYGSILIETDQTLEDAMLVGQTIAEPHISIGDENVELDYLRQCWQAPLEGVFPTRTKDNKPVKIPAYSYTKQDFGAPVYLKGKPKVLIPIFPGTNCEYDTTRQFTKAGADCQNFVIRNLTTCELQDAVSSFATAIEKSHIIMIPGGFSGGDEPDGSGKFIVAFFRNPQIQEALTRLLDNRDGLMLGICNGFQALIKLGLLPFGHITESTAASPTLTFNNIARHQSILVRTRVASVKSPWMRYNQVGDIHTIAISHGEGRFVAPSETIDSLVSNGQIITQYVDISGNPTSLLPFNPNGSMAAVEGICSPDGRILGKMGHSERIGDNLYKNIPGRYDQKIFKAGVTYFTGKE